MRCETYLHHGTAVGRPFGSWWECTGWGWGAISRVVDDMPKLDPLNKAQGGSYPKPKNRRQPRGEAA